MKHLFLFLAIMPLTGLNAQDLSGPELLEKAIAYHDPKNEWPSFQGTLFVTMTTPDEKERHSIIRLNLPKQYFELTTIKEGVTSVMTLKRDSCNLSLNGSSSFSEVEARKNRLTCERAQMMKNYYTYLYGLPMKLKDPGTIIATKVSRKTLKGKEYLVLKATYKKEVGNDIWYFYFDPKSYAMEAYQFFHDEAKNDGEYILLSETEQVSQMKIPKIRQWYYNKDDVFLGTDVLTKGSLSIK